jgi:YggT family protein
MFVLGNFFQALAAVLNWVLEIYWWLIVIRAVLSWVNPDPMNPIVQFIERATEPLLSKFRAWIPAYKIGIDLSPVFALMLIYFLKIFLVQTLLGLSVRLHGG